MIGQQIHDKLITDFAALKFEDDTTVLFSNVRKYFAATSMEPGDCLIIPDSNSEIIMGQSAGNTATTREYSFRAITFEQLEATDDNAAGSLKISRLMNRLDSVLEYLQKEPSNLNSWGNSNGIAIFKIRMRPVRFDTQQSEGGFSMLYDVPFSVYLNIVPQNL